MTFKPVYNLIEELRWRGLLHDSIPGTEELLQKERVTGYVGFDPTSDSLHIGNLVPVMLLLHLQRSGHRPVALVGGATGMVGDPSGKSEERNLLSMDILEINQKGVKAQLEKFLDFDAAENSALMVNNYDWFSKFGFLEFIRDVGKHITISYMLGKDSVQNRMESGLSFTEFSYQLVQGYDFCHLYKTLDCKLQMGGSDQWGNITTGTELVRRMEGGEAFAITAPLLTKSDGSKFGKSEGGNIWLDSTKTSPYKFYQYWLNVPDADAEKCIKIFTVLSQSEIGSLTKEHQQTPHLRILQKELGRCVTTLVHGETAWKEAVKASDVLFGNSKAEDFEALGEDLFGQVLEGIPGFDLSKSELIESINILELLAVKTPIFPSKGEARKMVQAGGVSIRKEKVESENLAITTKHLLFGKYLLVQKGKKNYFVITLN